MQFSLVVNNLQLFLITGGTWGEMINSRHAIITADTLVWSGLYNNYDLFTTVCILLLGVYTVPVTGQYVIMMHAIAEYDGPLELDVMVDNNKIYSTHTHTTNDYAYEGNTVVVHLNQVIEQSWLKLT